MTPLNRCSLQRFGACWIKPQIGRATAHGSGRPLPCAGSRVDTQRTRPQHPRPQHVRPTPPLTRSCLCGATVSRLCCLHMEHVARTGASSSRPYRSMVNKRNRQWDPAKPMVYHIRLTGHLGPQWTDWGKPTARRTCPVVDQAALHELLRRVRDVGMLLLSVNRVQTGYADAADGEPSIDARNADTDVCHRTPASFNRFPQLS